MNPLFNFKRMVYQYVEFELKITEILMVKNIKESELRKLILKLSGESVQTPLWWADRLYCLALKGDKFPD